MLESTFKLGFEKMKKFSSILAMTGFALALSADAFATSPDVYVVNFRNNTNTDSQILDSQLASAMAQIGGNAEEVIIDTSTAAKWEKSAHEAFDRNIVPVFNQWVGLPGFAAIVDANTKRVIGCVNGKFSASEMAREISKMSSRAQGSAFLSKASIGGKTTQCPPVYNVVPK